MTHCNAFILPNGKRVGLRAYRQAWQQLKALPADERVSGFFDFAGPAGEVLAALRAGLQDRINKADPRFGQGRRWNSDWQIQISRDARRLRDITIDRIRVYQFETGEVRTRFGHLLADHGDI
jgi:hypothetical protein